MNQKTKKRLIVQYFLRKLAQKMELEPVSEINPIFQKIYSKNELVDIVKWLYVPCPPDQIKVDGMDEEELLQAIGDEYHLLNYELEKDNNELLESALINNHSVQKTLRNLGMETHYLMDKPTTTWDEYDQSNYRALLYKAGNPLPVYGIFDQSVSESDKYLVTTPPNKLFDTKQETQEELEKLIKAGILENNAAKIMML